MTTLRRVVTLPQIVFYGLGNILGAGIYVLIGEVAAYSGMFIILAFLVAAVTAGLTAFTYAELVSRYPKSAGEAVYVQQGLGKRSLSILVGLLIILTGLVSAATIARGFVGYLGVFVQVPNWLAIVLVLSTLGFIAAWGIMESMRTAVIITLLEVAGLVIILFIGRHYFVELPGKLISFITPGTLQDWNGIMLGAFLAFYAFVGFEDMVNVAEEVKDVDRNLPIAIIITLGIATLLYLGVGSLALLVVSPEELGGTGAPMAHIYTIITGKDPYLISIISLFAVINGALIQIIMVSRVLYGMSSQQWMPAWFGQIHEKARTPINATLVVVITIIILALAFPLISLAKATSYLLLVVFALVNLSLFVIKLRKNNEPGAFTVPIIIPLFGVISCLVLLLAG